MAFWNTPDPAWPAVHPSMAGQPLLTSIIRSGAAEKFDFLLRHRRRGRTESLSIFLDWVTGEAQATRTMTVDAS
jgi:hypothetical protein